MGRLRSGPWSSPTVATWFSFGARALPLIVLPGFVFRAFTEEQAALWFALITLQGIQLLVESSIGLTFIRAIGFALGGATQVNGHDIAVVPQAARPANTTLLLSTWRAMKAIYLWIGILTLLFAGVGAWLSVSPLISKIEGASVYWAGVAVFVAGAALRAYGGLHISYLYGVGKIPLLRWWEMAFWGMAFLGALMALVTRMNFAMVALVYQAPLFANLGLNAMLARNDQRCRLASQKPNVPGGEVIAQLWPAMWRSSLGVSAYLLATQGAGLLYARVGPPSEVATYLFAMSLIRPMAQFAQAPFFTKLPALAALQAAGDRLGFRKISERSVRLSHALLAATIWAGAVLFLTISLLGGSSAKVPLILWASIGVGAFLERVGAIHLQLYSQTGHIVWHFANGGAALLFSLFAVLLFPGLDEFALPVSLILACLLFYIPYCMYYSYRAFNFGISFEIKTSVIPFASVIFLLFVALGTGC